MPRKTIGVFTIGDQKHQEPTSPTFQSHLQAAVHAVPPDPREGYGPSETRPMPRHKVIAAWLHCTALPLAEIAKGVTVLGGVKTSYSLVGKWRTEPAFRAVIEKAAAEMMEALTARYDRCWDDSDAFQGFKKEVVTFNPIIVSAILEYIAQLAKAAPQPSHERNMHEVNHAGLAIDYGSAWRLWSKKELRRACWKSGLTVSLTVDTLKNIFASAEKEGNWTLARKAFNNLYDVASGFAAQADARVDVEFKREKSRRAQVQSKKERRNSRQKGRTK